jgi:hypothetical protein
MTTTYIHARRVSSALRAETLDEGFAVQTHMPIYIYIYIYIYISRESCIGNDGLPLSQRSFLSRKEKHFHVFAPSNLIYIYMSCSNDNDGPGLNLSCDIAKESQVRNTSL